MNNMIQVNNLAFRYPKSEDLALNDLSFAIQEGEVTMLVGPNGSGKTTLLRHLCGLTLPQRGSIKIDGVELEKKNLREIRKLVGIVFQNPDDQLLLHQVDLDVGFGPRCAGVNETSIEQRVRESLIAVDALKLAGRVPLSLSFGEKKRVAIAGILAMNPSLMLLDEPTLGIDPWAKRKIIDILKNVSESRTLVVATHDYDLLSLGTRIFLLWEGRLRNVFTSSEQLKDSTKLL